MTEERKKGLMDVRPLEKVMAVLRSPGGCPWDQAQNHHTMRRELIEEVYELLEAIDDGNVRGMREELGDVLFQVVFHARLAEEEGLFTMQDVIDDVTAKLIHRHPHVFGTIEVNSTEEVLKNWETLKAEEKKERTSALDGIAKGLPALMCAYKLSERASRKGFEWPDASSARQKVSEEMQELDDAVSKGNRDNVEEELGDLLFALSVYARFLDLEPETALNRANNKFRRRFRRMEKMVEKKGKKWENLSQEQLIDLWNQAKCEKI
jgi:tetrapyrrole methylase family protein/MazG family protein